jgi:DNA-binding transcriptional LysR family regulator
MTGGTGTAKQAGPAHSKPGRGMGNRIDRRLIRNLDWNLLRTFAEIVRSGGVSKAARAMARQQPSVSSALKRLEDHLGVMLCKRGPSGFELTDHGKAMSEICFSMEKLLQSVPATLDEIAGELMYQVRLLVVGNLVSPRLDHAIALFSRTYPRAELLINVAPLPAIEERILKGDAEIGVAPVRASQERLNYRFLYREQHVVVCGATHPLAGRHFDDPGELAETPFILPEGDEAEPVRAYREVHGWGRNPAGQSIDLNEVRRMVIVGLGIALLPLEFLSSDIEAGRVHLLMEPSPDIQDDIYIISNPASPRYLAVEKFLEFLPPD